MGKVWDVSTVGTQLEALRYHNKIKTMKAMADLIDVKATTYRNWANGVNTPFLGELVNVANIFKIRLDYFLKEGANPANYSTDTVNDLETLILENKRLNEAMIKKDILLDEKDKCIKESQEKYNNILAAVNEVRNKF